MMHRGPLRSYVVTSSIEKAKHGDAWRADKATCNGAEDWKGQV